MPAGSARSGVDFDGRRCPGTPAPTVGELDESRPERDADGRTYYNSFKLDDEWYCVYECVHMMKDETSKKGNDEYWPAKITEIWSESDGKVCHVFRFRITGNTDRFARVQICINCLWLESPKNANGVDRTKVITHRPATRRRMPPLALNPYPPPLPASSASASCSRPRTRTKTSPRRSRTRSQCWTPSR